MIVVDSRTKGSLSMFVGAVPIDDEARMATLEHTVKDLQVD